MLLFLCFAIRVHIYVLKCPVVLVSAFEALDVILDPLRNRPWFRRQPYLSCLLTDDIACPCAWYPRFPRPPAVADPASAFPGHRVYLCFYQS